MNGLLLLYTRLVECHKDLLKAQADGTCTRDEAIGLVCSLASMCDIAVEMSEKKRTCPGRYWRQHKDTRDSIDAFNKNDRKRQKVTVDADCNGGELQFDKGYIGPPHEALGNEEKSRLLCNACGAALARDKKREFIKST